MSHTDFAPILPTPPKHPYTKIYINKGNETSPSMKIVYVGESAEKRQK